MCIQLPPAVDPSSSHLRLTLVLLCGSEVELESRMLDTHTVSSYSTLPTFGCLKHVTQSIDPVTKQSTNVPTASCCSGKPMSFISVEPQSRVLLESHSNRLLAQFDTRRKIITDRYLAFFQERCVSVDCPTSSIYAYGTTAGEVSRLPSQ